MALILRGEGKGKEKGATSPSLQERRQDSVSYPFHQHHPFQQDHQRSLPQLPSPRHLALACISSSQKQRGWLSWGAWRSSHHQGAWQQIYRPCFTVGTRKTVDHYSNLFVCLFYCCFSICLFFFLLVDCCITFTRVSPATWVPQVLQSCCSTPERYPEALLQHRGHPPTVGAWQNRVGPGRAVTQHRSRSRTDGSCTAR